jgi:hypothetical protein
MLAPKEATMNDPIRPPLPYPVVPPVPGTADETDNDTTETGLPTHEIDEDRSVGGGIVSKGGTAVDRGTGTTGGQAERLDDDDDDDDDDDNDGDDEEEDD